MSPRCLPVPPSSKLRRRCPDAGAPPKRLFAFFYLSILALISHMKDKSFNQTNIFLIFLSIILELFHYFIPNRSFEFLDLFANLLGTLIAIFIIIFYKKYKKIL